jgi:hypothetical protein
MEGEKTSTLTIIKRMGGVGWGSTSPVNQVAPSGGLVGGAPFLLLSYDDDVPQRPTATNETNMAAERVCVRVCEGIQKKEEQMAPHHTHTHNTRTH